MKFFYGFLVFALFAAAQAAPAEAEKSVATPEVAPVAEKTEVATTVEEQKQGNQALDTINKALESIISSGLLGDAVDFAQQDNVDLLIDSLKEMDPVLNFLENLRKQHPIFGAAITQYNIFRDALESQIRLLLAPFNLIIGAASALFRFFG